MIDTVIRDAAGRDRAIRSAGDVERLVAEIDRHRDELADIMLGTDIEAAQKAEQQSDYIEDVFLPQFLADLERVQALVDADAATTRRHAKARAIKERNA